MNLYPILLFCLATSVSGWQADPPYYAQLYTELERVRGLFVDPAGDLLVLSRGSGGVHVIFEEPNEDGTIDVVQEHLVQAPELGLNHGVTFHNGYIYASSAERVYRWPYTPAERTPVISDPETVVQGMPVPNDHDTRTIIFDNEGRLYISVGAEGNVDMTSVRARIRRFSLTGNLPKDFRTGEVFADGLRNEVGLSWNLYGVLYGVENGADFLNRPDLGGDLNEGNPAEEMNRFDGDVGQHYGYPYCFSSYNLTGYNAGTQFAWPTFMDDGFHDDNYCRNPDMNQPPQIPMPAHAAPLGIDFFRGQSCDEGEGAFPCSMSGDAFVAFHGSAITTIPVGYKVTRYPFQGEEPTTEEIDVVYEADVGTCDGGASCFRPVNAVFNQRGHLLVSSDRDGSIVKVTYGMPARPIRTRRNAGY